eukprot:gb/GFBE01071414.1/.p1 GENE.gb/GFBE01071414.1/~~gb/GFBE01071414.1/.p1  ORF type:complete len:731 (+),score=151.96 gb/GFBE01071414.1/:1-2193(+)
MQSQARRGQPRAAGEARAGGRSDVNHDRLIFCITSLIGQKVTACCRNNINYEGTFHSCSPDDGYSITLKCARRLPSEQNNKSGELVGDLIIQGKDFLQVSALNVPPISSGEEGRKGFATDAEISRKEGESARDLVPWQSAGGYQGGLEDGGLGPASSAANWDQFKANKDMYGVQSTYDEGLYTTKLDIDTIPLEKRAEADKIARDIEKGGNSFSEKENTGDGDGDDEEARFSAAQPLGGGGSTAVAVAPVKETKALARNNAPLPQLPERAGHNDALSGLPDRQGRKGMISEMKRINALNLEPTSAKHDDQAARSRMTNKEVQARSAARLGNSADLKQEFQTSLEIIKGQDAARQRKQGVEAGNGGQWDQGQMAKAGQPGGFAKNVGDQKLTPSAGLNPNARPFSLNPKAGEFTPSGGAAGNATPVAKAAGHAPSFSTYKKDPNMQRKSLPEILDPFLKRATAQDPGSAAPDWPDAKGPSYHEVLGQPNPGAQTRMMAPGGPAAGHMQTMGGGWQPTGQTMMGQPGQQQPGQQQPGQQVQQQPQQQQVQQQGGPPNQDQGGPPMVGGCGVGMVPQMMQQGFVVANPGGPGGPGGPPNQMQYGQMYGGPTGPSGHQGQGMAPQAFIVNGQPTMMGQGGSQMVPMGMVAPQGQNPGQMGMAPMPKFGGGNQQQVMVMPVMIGNYGQQGGFMQGPMQGQGGMAPQGGPPGGPPQGDGGQGQMMQNPGMGYPGRG